MQGFLEGLREITDRYGIPLIFDEVVTGFRLSYGGAQEYYGVTPDLCTLGKAVAGGFPLTAVAGREEIMRHFDAGAVEHDSFMPQIGTLSGNPVAAVAGLATLRILKREGQYERLFAAGQNVMDTLQRLLNEAEIPAKVVGEPPVFDVYFTDTEIADYRSTLTADKGTLNRFNRLLLDRGIFKGDNQVLPFPRPYGRRPGPHLRGVLLRHRAASQLAGSQVQIERYVTSCLTVPHLSPSMRRRLADTRRHIFS